MENKLEIKFLDEKNDFQLDILQPDLAQLIHFLIENNISVTKENMKIKTENEGFDSEEFLEILVSVHDEFKNEIDKFYENIENEISTYYPEAEDLSNEIIEKLKMTIK